MSSSASKNMRICSSKSRNGCRNCKTRRVKCSEEKPACRRCVAAGRECEYVPVSDTRKGSEKGLVMVNYVAEVPKLVSPIPFKDARECRSLAFFFERTAVELSGPFLSELWSRHILQTVQVEPVVRHAVIALASLHEDSQLVGPTTFANGDYAKLHYAKAIQEFVNYPVLDDSRRISLALILCVLFTSFDCLRGFVVQAFSHIQSGLRIIREESAKGTTTLAQSSVPWKTILNQFRHLESQMFEMQGYIHDQFDDEETLFRKYLTNSPSESFRTLEEAQESMEELYNNLNHFISLRLRNIHMTPRHAKFVYYFNVWSAKFNAFQQGCQTRAASMDTRRGILILQIWQKLLHVRLSFFYEANETDFDKHSSIFSSVVTLAETTCRLQSRNGDPLKFSVSTGIVAPLYMTVTRCRDPLIRRRALSLLKQANSRDGLWASNTVAPVAERILELEESAALKLITGDKATAVISEASQIPETCRIRDLDVRFQGARQGLIIYGRRKHDIRGNLSRDCETVFSEKIFW